MVISVKPYTYTMEKIKAHVQINESVYVNEKEDDEYILKGMVMHSSADVNSGHYTAALKSSDNQWFLADDTKIKTVSFEEVSGMASTNCYILFYEKDASKEEIPHYTIESALHKDASKKIVAQVEDIMLAGVVNKFMLIYAKL